MSRRPILGKVLVPGRAGAGQVKHHPRVSNRDYVLVTRKLTVRDCSRIRNCAAVVCEEGGVSDHPAVICRIIGRPMMQIDGAVRRFREGECLTVVPHEAAVYAGTHPLPCDPLTDVERAALRLLQERGARVQVSILDEQDIARVNRVRLPSCPVDHFFVREELLWVKHGYDPFAFLQRAGGRRTQRFLVGCLRPCLQLLSPGQTLNFRALDMRSDESPAAVAARPCERNPHLGNHGVRRLLGEPRFHAAAIRAALSALRSRDAALL